MYTTNEVHYIPSRFLYSQHGAREVPFFVTCFVTTSQLGIKSLTRRELESVLFLWTHYS